MWEKLIDFNDRFPGTVVTMRGSSLTPGSPLQKHVGWNGARGGGAPRSHAYSLEKARVLTGRAPPAVQRLSRSGCCQGRRGAGALEGLHSEDNARGGGGRRPASGRGAWSWALSLGTIGTVPGGGEGPLGVPRGRKSRPGRVGGGWARLQSSLKLHPPPLSPPN